MLRLEKSFQKAQHDDAETLSVRKALPGSNDADSKLETIKLVPGESKCATSELYQICTRIMEHKKPRIRNTSQILKFHCSNSDVMCFLYVVKLRLLPKSLRFLISILRVCTYISNWKNGQRFKCKQTSSSQETCSNDLTPCLNKTSLWKCHTTQRLKNCLWKFSEGASALTADAIKLIVNVFRVFL